jgi:hypothetical protein
MARWLGSMVLMIGLMASSGCAVVETVVITVHTRHGGPIAEDPTPPPTPRRIARPPLPPTGP